MKAGFTPSEKSDLVDFAKKASSPNQGSDHQLKMVEGWRINSFLYLK